MAEYDRKLQKQESRAMANNGGGSKQLKEFVDSRFVNNDGIVQQKLSISGEAGKIEEEKTKLNQAYKVGFDLKYTDADKDPYGNPQYIVSENNGIGSHLIGKIIDDGDVHIYFGEDRNEAAPKDGTEMQKADKGEPCSSKILLASDAEPIQLIHELIHSYHLAFDPWTAEQKNAQVKDGDRTSTETAEEVSTVGLGEWDDFELTENSFRKEMGLPKRTHYGL